MPYEKLCKKYKLKLSLLDKQKEQINKWLITIKNKIVKIVKGRK